MRLSQLLCLAVVVQTSFASAQAASQYARTARKGHVFTYMYRTPTAFCHPRLGSNTLLATNNLPLQIVRRKTVKCGLQSALLMQATILQGIHAGETGYFRKADLIPAFDLNH